jgi:hypothetical protein
MSQHLGSLVPFVLTALAAELAAAESASAELAAAADAARSAAQQQQEALQQEVRCCHSFKWPCLVMQRP